MRTVTVPSALNVWRMESEATLSGIAVRRGAPRPLGMTSSQAPMSDACSTVGTGEAGAGSGGGDGGARSYATVEGWPAWWLLPSRFEAEWARGSGLESLPAGWLVSSLGGERPP